MSGNQDWLGALFAGADATFTAPAEPVAQAPTPARKAEYREYVRCCDCLGMTVIGTPWQAGTRCALCGGAVESMGRVKGALLVHAETRCKCNEACASARGPICTCRCGGEHHGVGLAGFVTVDVAHGSVPTVAPATDQDKAQQTADEWRKAKADFLAVYGPLRDAVNARVFLPRSRFDLYLGLKRCWGKAHEMRSQAGRLRVLADAVKWAQSETEVA